MSHTLFNEGLDEVAGGGGGGILLIGVYQISSLQTSKETCNEGTTQLNSLAL